MNGEQFQTLLDAVLDEVRAVLSTKADEYATSDRLHNFQIAAELQNVKPRQALGGMMAKHTVSVYDLIEKLELAPMHVWDEKIIDHINYLILLRACVKEESNRQIFHEITADSNTLLNSQD